VQTLDRAVGVLAAVAEGPASLAELVERTALPRPTVHRLAVACERHGLLARDGDGRFRLGARLVGWGAAAVRVLGRGIAAAADPVLAGLVDATGESAQLYVREGDRRVCVAARERPSGLRDTVPLGSVMPLTLGSGGKVLLAWAPDRDRFAREGLDLATVRRRGFAESVGEREAGVASVSAPVRSAQGEVVAAISVSGPADRLGPWPGRRLGAPVQAAAARLAAAIGA
jgi:DNA-binding IclR family transcriptional regulator